MSTVRCEGRRSSGTAGAVNVYHWEDTNVNVTTEERIARNNLILLSGCERSVVSYPEMKRVVRSRGMTLKRGIE
jgi:hypothetical protein